MLASYKKLASCGSSGGFLFWDWASQLMRNPAEALHPSSVPSLIHTGAVVPNATVEIHNPVSAFDRTTNTDSAGKFSIPECSIQSLSPDGRETGFASLRSGR